MRWKLLVIASLLAALLGVGVTAMSFATLMNRSAPAFLTSPFSPLFYVVPSVGAASFFVYRHTARRRKLQALLTALLSIVFTTALFFAASFYFTVRG